MLSLRTPDSAGQCCCRDGCAACCVVSLDCEQSSASASKCGFYLIRPFDPVNEYTVILETMPPPTPPVYYLKQTQATTLKGTISAHLDNGAVTADEKLESSGLQQRTFFVDQQSCAITPACGGALSLADSLTYFNNGDQTFDDSRTLSKTCTGYSGGHLFDAPEIVTVDLVTDLAAPETPGVMAGNVTSETADGSTAIVHRNFGITKTGSSGEGYTVSVSGGIQVENILKLEDPFTTDKLKETVTAALPAFTHSADGTAYRYLSEDETSLTLTRLRVTANIQTSGASVKFRFRHTGIDGQLIGYSDYVTMQAGAAPYLFSPEENGTYEITDITCVPADGSGGGGQ